MKKYLSQNRFNRFFVLTLGGWLLFCLTNLGTFPLIQNVPLIQVVQAQTTDTSKSGTDSAELRESIRERIEKTLQAEDKLPEFLGYIGTINQVGTATFSFTNPLGTEHTVQVSNETTLLEDGDEIDLDELVIGNGVTVMGSALDELVIEARRVLTSDDTFVENRQVSLGTIAEIDSSELTLVSRQNDQSQTWEINRQTRYEDSLGTSLTRNQIEDNQAALVITDENNDGERFVKKIHLLVALNEVDN